MNKKTLSTSKTSKTFSVHTGHRSEKNSGGRNNRCGSVANRLNEGVDGRVQSKFEILDRVVEEEL